MPEMNMKPLTQTEKRILDLVGQGMSSMQIAIAMEISEHNEEIYRRTTLARFGAKNSEELMKKAIWTYVLRRDASKPQTQLL